MANVMEDIGKMLKEVYSPAKLVAEMEKTSAFFAHISGNMTVDYPKQSYLIHDLAVPDEEPDAPEVFIDPFPTGRLICLEER